MAMTIMVLRIAGNVFYFIGILILVPSGLIIITSVNTLLLAGPLVLIVPVLGLVIGGAGKWMRRKARQLEDARRNSIR
ncbi:MAG: hypothetical protein EOO17_01545 [Chloroflexi bacterium]|nr:MAG: hypothetical protein EOO17_01545 [Chloroflexota bacterium]